MPLIAAKCTQCGANIEVDDTKEAGICKYCGTPFITEKAIYYYNQNISIENATINVQGVDVNNLLLRAQQFENEENSEKAKDYYNKVLDIDINNEIAKAGMERLNNTLIVDGKTVSIEIAKRVESLLREGQKILAIKEVREATGAGLKEAKDAVEAYADKRGIEITHTSSGSSQGCYIATCVYGSYDCPEVWTLRRFRDYTLDPTWSGRLFIRSYYVISPTVVRLFGNTRIFRRFWKNILDQIVKKLNNKGVLDTEYVDKY